jgi:hypothetical protein
MKPSVYSFIASLALAFAAHSAQGQEIFGALDTLKTTTSSNASAVLPRGPKPIKKEISIGYRLHTRGWSVYADYGTVKAKNARLSDMFYNIRFWQLEVGEKKAPEQEKLVIEDANSGRVGSYYYGKINNFYAVKLGYGFRKLLAGKPDPGSVSIHWSVVAGPALGALKPYYVKNINTGNVKYSTETQSQFLAINQIVDKAGFGTGLGETKYAAGGHLKTMLHFDFAATRYTVSAIETGVDVQYYSQNMPIMLNAESKPYFVDVFVAFQLGKRW